MNIEQKLTEITDYLKQKVLDGDYEFLSSDRHTAKVKIDGLYEIRLWIANIPKKHFALYDASFIVETKSKLLKFNSDKDRLKAYNNLKVFIEKDKKRQLKELKQDLELQLKNLEQ